MTDTAPKQITAVRWPQVAPHAERYVLDALHSGRWAITSMNNGANLYERKSESIRGLSWCDLLRPN